MIGIIVSSTNDDHLNEVNEIIDVSHKFAKISSFELIDLYRYGLAHQTSDSEPEWWHLPRYTAALDWSRELSRLDGIVFIIDGPKGFELAVNGLHYLQSEITLKPVDVIVVNSDKDLSRITALRSRLSDLRALLLPNGFELSQLDADVLREPFSDEYYSENYRLRITQAFHDLALISGALKSKPKLVLHS